MTAFHPRHSHNSIKTISYFEHRYFFCIFALSKKYNKKEYMEEIVMQLGKLQVFNQFWLTIFLLVPLVLISRTVVAGTRYSPILLVVIFGLIMGFILVITGVSEPGLPEFQMIDILSKTTIIPLIASFFVGGQELRKVFGKIKLDVEEFVVPSDEEICVGTTRTQLVYIARTFFLLVGIETTHRLMLGTEGFNLMRYYPLYAYIGLVCSIILIDYKAKFRNKRLYIKKGVVEIAAIILVLILTFHIAAWIRPFIALPQIFFAMLVACTLGVFFYKWHFGPTIKSLLFAGLPIVLAGNFIIGGSRILDAFSIEGMNSVLVFGFFGQMLWMFGGIALLIYFAKTTNVRNLAPGLAGGLSHAGLTGACTAGDFGPLAQSRAPITVNMPFAVHIFVHSILAMSAARGELLTLPAVIVLTGGIIVTIFALRFVKRANAIEGKEIKALMMFALGWQTVSIFGSVVLLTVAGMGFQNVTLAATSSISHFGLFSAIQGGMFGPDVAEQLPFIFAMPFLVHPVVFFLFGKTMDRGGEMPKIPVFILAGIGILGIVWSLFLI
jgi:hypothetical protein